MGDGEVTHSGERTKMLTASLLIDLMVLEPRLSGADPGYGL